jgi:polysaccharide biosynthesis protein PslE
MLRPPTAPPAPSAVLLAFWRHRRKMAIFFLLVLGVVAVVAVLMPRAYRSQAKLFLRLGRENVVVDPAATLGQTPAVAVPLSRENELNSVLDLLKRPVLLEQIVARLGPAAILGGGPLPPDAASAPPGKAPDEPLRSPWNEGLRPGDERYKALARLSKMLDVEIVKKSDVLQVTCDGPSPEVAQAIVTTLIDLYVEEHGRLNRTPGAYRFMSEQTARLREQLTQAEEELRDLKTKTGLISPEAQRQALVTRISKLQDDLLVCEESIASSKATIRQLREQLDRLPQTQVSSATTGHPNVAADSLRVQLHALRIKEKELTTRYPERHPLVVEVRQQVAAAEALAAKEEPDREQVTTGPHKLYEEARLALLREEPLLGGLQARARELRDQLAQQRDSLADFTRDQQRIARLQREVDLHEGHYRKYADNLQQVQIDGALAAEKLSNISIVQPATFDPSAVRPNLRVIFAIGFVFALGGSVVLALLCERLALSPRTAEKIPLFGLPVAASVPNGTANPPAQPQES